LAGALIKDEPMSDKETKQTNYLPLFLVGGLLFFALQSPSKEGGGQSSGSAVRTAGEVLPNVRSAFRDAFLKAADKIEAKEITTQEQWTKFIADNAGGKYREAIDKVYKAIDDLKLPATFDGREAEIAKLNRDIGRAW
jgi:flagellar hook-basal body complex protein FliE